jgi:hypothetical protein
LVAYAAHRNPPPGTLVTVAARGNSRLLLRWSAVLAAAVLLAAGCTSGGRSEGGQATTPTTGAAPAQPLRIRLVATAKVPPGGLSAKRAAQRAAPGLERFLDRYLSAAFVDAAGGEAGWDGLLGLFDKPVRASAGKQLDALSLGQAAPTVTAVRPGQATAKAVVLYGDQKPEAATVRVSFDGTADTAQGSGPVHLRSVLQLLATGDSWRIAAFDSRTGPPK